MRKTLTVGELKEKLSPYADDVNVYIFMMDCEWDDKREHCEDSDNVSCHPAMYVHQGWQVYADKLNVCIDVDSAPWGSYNEELPKSVKEQVLETWGMLSLEEQTELLAVLRGDG